ncbi:hypothetical protein OK016_27815 [Vibrio chagasii]|nr:hypothetical protein [Vibrio chagasii]
MLVKKGQQLLGRECQVLVWPCFRENSLMPNGFAGAALGSLVGGPVIVGAATKRKDLEHTEEIGVW